MESLTGRFEAGGSDGRSYTVLAYTTLTVANPGADISAGERLATSDGLTVVHLAADLYFTIQTGVRLTRRPGTCSAEAAMRLVMTARAVGSDGREYALRAYEAVPAGRATPGDRDDRPGMSVLETSDGHAVSVGAAGELTIDATGVILKLAGGG